jgi:Branched-chain amino acid transport protein (AzlD)
MIFTTIVVLGTGCALIKAAGPIALGERALPPAAKMLVDGLSPALLAGLVVATTLSRNQAIVLDSRVAGIAAAIVVARVRGPLMLALASAAAVTTLIEWLG